jgi:hypothetical protein
MQIKMKTLAAGPLFVYFPGAIVDMEPVAARHLVDANFAEYVTAPSSEPPEKPVQAPKPQSRKTQRRGASSLSEPTETA